MTEEIKIPVMSKQMQAAGTPFKVINKVPRDSWTSNYAYWLKQKTAGLSQRPLLGRMAEGDQFQVYTENGWEDKDLWNDYSEEVIENGEPVRNAKGNIRKRLFFDNRKEFLLEFESPVVIELWDKEIKQTVTEEHKQVYVRMSKSLAGKLQEQFEDSRNSDETYYMINYDRSKSPAEQYTVKFNR